MNDPVLIDLTNGQKHKLPTNIEHFVIKVFFYLEIQLLAYFI